MTLPSPSFDFQIPYAIRNRHIYIAGSSQHGKSTLMERLIAQDLSIFHNGHFAGVTVLDPKSGGPLAELCLTRIPEKRKNEAIYLDIANPVPIDLMSWDTVKEYQTLQGELFNLFTSFSPASSTDQWPNLLRATIATLLAAKDCAFADINKFTANPHFKVEIIKRCEKNNQNGRYQNLLDYWKFEAPKLHPETPRAILGRMKPFMFSPIYNLINHPSPKLKISDVIRDRKILIVNLGTLDDNAGNLAGRLIVMKIMQAVFRQDPKKAIPHFFHADEFQNFQTSAFDKLLAEVGTFRLCMTLANQGLYQLDEKIRKAVFTNVTAAKIAFNLNHDDVSNWKYMLPSKDHMATTPDGEEYWIKPDTLARLSPYKAFFKVEGHAPDIKKTKLPLPAPTSEDLDRAAYIKKNTHDTYGENQKISLSPSNPSQEPEKMVRLENEPERADSPLPFDRATGKSPRTSGKARTSNDQ